MGIAAGAEAANSGGQFAALCPMVTWRALEPRLTLATGESADFTAGTALRERAMAAVKSLAPMPTLRTETTGGESQRLPTRPDTSNATRRNEACDAGASAKLARTPRRDSLPCKTSYTMKRRRAVSAPQGINSTAPASTCSSTAIALPVSKHRKRPAADVTCVSNVCAILTARRNGNSQSSSIQKALLRSDVTSAMLQRNACGGSSTHHSGGNSTVVQWAPWSPSSPTSRTRA
jgi:hypothetical protein